ncbi:3-hydroxyacyl-CoA dehydrogenase NAD-binding domain-containing protein [Amycolatopsis echigonensis]|uniref:Enoyl-CoA hydratase/isomerase family protein n=1 Tax=Amycolatopsis echigonensis TaxID=2576905 RepID=A0A8E1W221_9PSEU|nr:3-hydroxyacyl-CoA dehydrogenase NAD-binding domain-containing protein [Amycolatopsis echigonensis]MBB2502355.1 enoyl-CoA hydratase/isomerase family protein [Amycolatopsis echigonensis]
MSLVDIELRGTVAVLTIDHPPVNAGSADQRAALAEALAAIPAEAEGVVVTSAGKHFYAGSDLREFDRPLASPQLPDVLRLIEDLPVPVVAAVSGLALGGGLEFALACDARVADSTARFGFPEVTFGILPGAGGTVRTARLIGVPNTIDLVTSARQVSAEEALELGLVDAVVPGESLLAAATEMVRRGKRVLRTADAPGVDRAAVDEALARMPRRARPNVRRAAEMAVRGAQLDGDTALAEERMLFDELRATEESASLRYLFFARQDAAKALRSKAKPRDLRRVGIVGAGTMGAALAEAFASAGFPVRVVDTNEAALDRLEPPVETAVSLSDLADADLVVDAVFEDMGVKQTLLRELEPVLHDETVIVSNTSYLDLDEMAKVLERRERFAGLHFFNPPDRNPLVEVIRTAATDDETFSTLGTVVRKLGKTGIPAGIGDGFVANRVYADYRTQAEFLVEEGASPQQVDEALVACGMAIGPFAVADLSGLDIAWARRKRLAASRDPRRRYVPIADWLCEDGRFGRKTGSGWYRYPEGARRGEPDPFVARLIERNRAEKRITAREVDDAEIWRRVLGTMVAAAARLVEDGTARNARDIDVALTEGFAFPRWLGGPVRAFSRLAPGERVSALAEVFQSCPATFEILEPAARGVLPREVEVLLSQVV